jgi:hypothetical protein
VPLPRLVKTPCQIFFGVRCPPPGAIIPPPRRMSRLLVAPPIAAAPPRVCVRDPPHVRALLALQDLSQTLEFTRKMWYTHGVNVKPVGAPGERWPSWSKAVAC